MNPLMWNVDTANLNYVWNSDYNNTFHLHTDIQYDLLFSKVNVLQLNMT